MNQRKPPSDHQLLSRALAQMAEALRILDECDAPGEIGADLDLAVARLESHLGLIHGLSGSAIDLFERGGMGAVAEGLCQSELAGA